MVTFEERIYELASEALAEQERNVGQVRARAPALVAAGTVIPSLLAKTIFHGRHPHGVLEVGATVLGFLGAAGVLVFAVLLLRSYNLGFSADGGAMYRWLWDEKLLQQPKIDIAIAQAFDERRRQNACTVEVLLRRLDLALAALVMEAVFFGLAAALAS
jgi:hypothetical protein